MRRIFVFWWILGALTSCAYTPQIRSAKGSASEPIAELKQIKLGGVEQWVMIRGNDIRNPVLLFVHGGPGAAEMPLLSHFNRELEKYFTVITWDQRGAGKSNRVYISDQSITLDQLLQDTYELVQYCRTRFHQEKIFLMGHSWGTVLALKTVSQYPDLFYAYVGIAQVVDLEKNLRTSYNEITRMVLENRDSEALGMLARVDLSVSGIRNNSIDNLMELRHWLARNGRLFYGRNGYFRLGWVTICSHEYSIPDLFRMAAGLNRSKRLLWNESLFDIRFQEQITEVKVPLFIAAGAHDLLTCTEIAESYYKTVTAPQKEFKVFEQSSHCPLFEEASLFNQWMLERVLPIAGSDSHQ